MKQNNRGTHIRSLFSYTQKALRNAEYLDLNRNNKTKKIQNSGFEPATHA